MIITTNTLALNPVYPLALNEAVAFSARVTAGLQTIFPTFEGQPPSLPASIQAASFLTASPHHCFHVLTSQNRIPLPQALKAFHDTYVNNPDDLFPIPNLVQAAYEAFFRQGDDITSKAYLHSLATTIGQPHIAAHSEDLIPSRVKSLSPSGRALFYRTATSHDSGESTSFLNLIAQSEAAHQHRAASDFATRIREDAALHLENSELLGFLESAFDDSPWMTRRLANLYGQRGLGKLRRQDYRHASGHFERAADLLVRGGFQGMAHVFFEFAGITEKRLIDRSSSHCVDYRKAGQLLTKAGNPYLALHANLAGGDLALARGEASLDRGPLYAVNVLEAALEISPDARVREEARRHISGVHVVRKIDPDLLLRGRSDVFRDAYLDPAEAETEVIGMIDPRIANQPL
ncbi:MAG: hypothetical protein HY540_03620 [Deltaproteobacteria bacterium]|nr:hypothetical protein [Deltaproteobacteria bacterium]